MDRKTLIRNTALNTLRIETEALQALPDSINESFCRCVEAIYEARGKLIVTGIGKSALIGQKITATLNSTGTTSVFMHAADAIHGDLGIVSPDDLILCLSKSGETPEIKVLMPLVKHLGNPLIAMVGSLDSSLARQADFVLHTPIDKEADPNNLAPTASTTAQAALGDALATALLALRGFSPKDFAQFHPGGTLGKQLYLRVDDLYPLHPRPVVWLNDNLRKVIVEITSSRLGATAVLNENNGIEGIVTDGDLRRMLENENLQISTVTAKDIMTTQPKTIQTGELAVHALQKMRANSITQLLVLKDGQYVGMVHLHDLIREGLI